MIAELCTWANTFQHSYPIVVWWCDVQRLMSCLAMQYANPLWVPHTMSVQIKTNLVWGLAIFKRLDEKNKSNQMLKVSIYAGKSHDLLFIIKFLTKSQKRAELHQNSRESCGVKPRNYSCKPQFCEARPDICVRFWTHKEFFFCKIITPHKTLSKNRFWQNFDFLRQEKG